VLPLEAVNGVTPAEPPVKAQPQLAGDAQIILSEIRVDMTSFPTTAHLASWAEPCPGNNESAGNTAQANL
jgi:hypothetical protein